MCRICITKFNISVHQSYMDRSVLFQKSNDTTCDNFPCQTNSDLLLFKEKLNLDALESECQIRFILFCGFLHEILKTQSLESEFQNFTS